MPYSPPLVPTRIMPLTAVGAIVYALQNDYPAISAFIEKGTLVEATACVTVPFPDAVPSSLKDSDS